MNEWREVRLGDLCEHVTVGHVGKMSDQYIANGVPFLRSQDVAPFSLNIVGCRRVSTEFHERLKKSALRSGDLVIVRTGYPGTAAVVPDSVGEMNCADLVVIRPRPELDPWFLAAYFNSTHGQSVVGGKLVGSAQQHFNVQVASEMRILLPQLEGQYRIARIIRGLTELIEINERRIELLENLARSLYREWFVRFRFPGHENIAFVDSELGPIPERWELRPVAAMASKERHAVSSGPFGSKLGRKDYRDGGVPVIRGTNLDLGGGFHDAGFVFVAPEKADELAASIARPGDIVITQRGTLGQVGLVPSNALFDRYVISQSQMKVTVDPAVGSPQYLYFVLRSPEATQRILNMAISTGVPHINLAMLREMPVMCPPRDLQHKFEKLVAPMIELLEQYQRAIVRLASTRDLVLPRLVTGRLEISDIDLGELVPSGVA